MSFYAKSFSHLKVEIKPYQLWLTLDNPQQSHAISSAMIESLTEVLFHAESDPEVRVMHSADCKSHGGLV